MPASKRTPIRFSLLTATVWLAVAAGIIFLLWQVITRISDNNLPINTSEPDITQQYQTSAAKLTPQQTRSLTTTYLTASPSPAAKLTFTPLASPVKTLTPAGNIQTSPSQVRCDQAAAGNPIDITIPDDTIISPGQSFTKTWKLINRGSCTWTGAYSARFFYGDRMEAPDMVFLPETVLPSHSVEISIEMIAPLVTGSYQGNWKLSNTDGVLFGIGPNGDSPFWVRIMVSQSPVHTTTLTPGGTQTSIPTGTTTPPIQASGELSLLPGDTIDLDTLTLNAVDADLAYQPDSNPYHWLAPHEGSKLGVFGNQEPNLADCQAASMSPAPIAVESLSVGTFLCYATNENRSGRALLKALDPDDFTLTLDLLTWASP